MREKTDFLLYSNQELDTGLMLIILTGTLSEKYKGMYLDEAYKDLEVTPRARAQ